MTNFNSSLGYEMAWFRIVVVGVKASTLKKHETVWRMDIAVLTGI